MINEKNIKNKILQEVLNEENYNSFRRTLKEKCLNEITSKHLLLDDILSENEYSSFKEELRQSSLDRLAVQRSECIVFNFAWAAGFIIILGIGMLCLYNSENKDFNEVEYFSEKDFNNITNGNLLFSHKYNLSSNNQNP